MENVFESDGASFYDPMNNPARLLTQQESKRHKKWQIITKIIYDFDDEKDPKLKDIKLLRMPDEILTALESLEMIQS